VAFHEAEQRQKKKKYYSTKCYPELGKADLEVAPADKI
jgi:hypothetical protein